MYMKQAAEQTSRVPCLIHVSSMVPYLLLEVDLVNPRVVRQFGDGRRSVDIAIRFAEAPKTGARSTCLPALP